MPLSFKDLHTRLERLTKTDLTYVFQGSFWLIIGQGITIFSGLISSTLFAHFVPASDYGTYRYLLGIYGLLSIFTLSGIRTAITRRISQGHDQEALILGIRTQIQGACIGSAVSLCLALWYFFHNNPLLGYGLSIIALFLLFTDTLDISSYFQGQKNFKQLFIYTSSITLGTLGTALIGIKLHPHPLTFLILFLGTTALIRIYFLPNIRLLFQPITASIALKKDIIQFGSHLSLLNAISVAANSLDKILLFHFLSPVIVAQYAFVTALPNQLRGLIRNLGTLALPKFSQRTESEIRHGLISRLPLLTGGIILLIITYALCAPVIFRLLFPQYLAIVKYSQFFCISILDSVTYPISSALAAHKKTKALSYMTLSIYIIDIGLMVLLIPPFGLWGIVFAKTASRSITVILGVSMLFNLKTSTSPATTVIRSRD